MTCERGHLINRRTNACPRGFTILELLVVIALIGILICMAGWCSKTLARGWQLIRAGHQLYEDLKGLQSQAEMSGSLTMSSNALVTQRAFMVFDVDDRNYRTYLWLDHNGNGVAEVGESRQLQLTKLPAGISFGWGPDVDRRACSNSNSPPGNSISFSSPDYPPCNDRPCIKFNHLGFSVMGPGGIYLTDSEQSLAITGTRPGHFTICEWDGERWR